MRRRANGLTFVLASLWLAGSAAIAQADEINLYSTREVPPMEPVIASFTAATGIKVNLTYVEDNLVKRVTAEGDASPADVLLTIGFDKTTQFVTSRLTQTISSPLLDNAIPPQLRGAQWVALSVRPRVVMARADAAPGAIHYEDLAESKWRGKLCIRSPLHQNNVALIAAYLVHHGAETTEAWLNGVKANLVHKPAGKDNDVIREIAQGTCEIGIGNTVALAQLRAGREGGDWSAWARAVKAVPTAFRGGNTHVNLTGAAIAKIPRVSRHTGGTTDLCSCGTGISGACDSRPRSDPGGDRIVLARCTADRSDRRTSAGRNRPHQESRLRRVNDACARARVIHEAAGENKISKWAAKLTLFFAVCCRQRAA
jgi:iron(III) transport system substrate-binding protein